MSNHRTTSKSTSVRPTRKRRIGRVLTREEVKAFGLGFAHGRSDLKMRPPSAALRDEYAKGHSAGKNFQAGFARGSQGRPPRDGASAIRKDQYMKGYNAGFEVWERR